MDLNLNPEKNSIILEGYGQDYIKIIQKVQKLLDNFNIKINNKLNDAVQDWHKTK